MPALRFLLPAVVWALCSAATFAAESAWTRDEALERLDARSADERRQAILRLAEVGIQGDTERLAARLFDDDPQVRGTAEATLWQIWSRSGDPAIDRQLAEGTALMQVGRLDEAISLFSGIVRDQPDFAEGWNKRATAYFLAGDLDRSLADCDEVMKRNPWHFGALAGYGLIWFQKDQPTRALEYWRRALAVNPNMDGVRTNVEAIERLLEQRRRNQT